MNRQRTNRISTGFTVEVSTEGTQLSYSNFDYLGQEPHYWQLPGVYQGDKVSIKEAAAAAAQSRVPARAKARTLEVSGLEEACRPTLLLGTAALLLHFESFLHLLETF